MIGAQGREESYRVAREKLIAELKALGINQRVLDVMAKIPREKFVSAAFKSEAYKNSALPIGENQTISQPYVVALMTHALDVHHEHKVLEIGTGCGYQAAVLSKFARRVFSIERFETLSKEADKRLHDLRIYNVSTRVGDGTLGWPEQAPFDRIMATAASPEPPRALVEQMATGGVMVIPIGEPDGEQKLMRYKKNEDGSLSEYFIGYVRFVPMVGVQGVPEVIAKRKYGG